MALQIDYNPLTLGFDTTFPILLQNTGIDPSRYSQTVGHVSSQYKALIAKYYIYNIVSAIVIFLSVFLFVAAIVAFVIIANLSYYVYWFYYLIIPIVVVWFIVIFGFSFANVWYRRIIFIRHHAAMVQYLNSENNNYYLAKGVQLHYKYHSYLSYGGYRYGGSYGGFYNYYNRYTRVVQTPYIEIQTVGGFNQQQQNTTNTNVTIIKEVFVPQQQPQQNYYQPNQPQQNYYQPNQQQPQQNFYQPNQPQQNYYQPNQQQPQQYYQPNQTQQVSDVNQQPQYIPQQQQQPTQQFVYNNNQL